MANGWSLVIGLIVIVVFCGVSWCAAPKGENQTVWRSTLILSAVACFLMWAITFLAQWHPLIQPIRNDLRPEHTPSHRAY
ncbi:V-type proton ATPase subunit E [Lepidopterella palustris CBS 459.81]|uniref:V-type proton ATPase subunit E n=1 Tax=Lepidopterella palustris CBS 459.81 TaxID=1314670 RepID=A0A8E2DY68_9PEZI|nr:V-type proton ATPase subunit E [Lepidopterella palustris CBS 459.81]